MQNNEVEKFFKITKEIAELLGKDTSEIIKKACSRAGLKLPNYQYFQSLSNLNDIKKGDVLIFNMDYTELKNKKIYLLEINLGIKVSYVFGEYNKDYNLFIYGNATNDYIENNTEFIKVLGILTKIEKNIKAQENEKRMQKHDIKHNEKER